MRTGTTIRWAAATVSTAAALAATATAAGATPPQPSPAASCVATVTVTETRIAPGSVGDETKTIAGLGPDALPSIVRSLTDSHLGNPETCAALIGESPRHPL
jgi:hypothetical protein